MYHFQYFDFTPREVFHNACSRWLQAMLERVPRDATCRASVTKVKHGYFFSVIIHSSVGTFEAETFLDETTSDRSKRDWQIIALEFLERKMLNQLRTWIHNRDVEEGFQAAGHASEEFFKKAA